MNGPQLSALHPHWTQVLAAAAPERSGVVSELVGLGLRVQGLEVPVGSVLHVGAQRVAVDVVAASCDGLHCMPLASLQQVKLGDPVHASLRGNVVPAGPGLLGRVIDGLGRPIDGRGPLGEHQLVDREQSSPPAMERGRITEPLDLGVRALDTLCTVGAGQRLGLFAGSGVGKSSLLSMIARGTAAQVNVIALIGERGREVREFLEDDLGQAGLARSVVVVSTADEPARMRLRAAQSATRIAEHFRAQGAQVVLMMDSLTRVAMAQREIGLSAGEPPATRGYPPSTFAVLAGLLERAGRDAAGSITGIYTVLVDGDDHNEPIADAARSLLDGHVVLDRALAVQGHFPSINVLGSVSRLAGKVATAQQKQQAGALRRALAARASVQDLIDVGAYQPGANPEADAAVAHRTAIDGFLRQRLEEPSAATDSWRQLQALLASMGIQP
ncbi:FliI/YscN family ATPase [Glutamicibacter nicotianae]|uniref:FliI/YscN family ATPase n=1 Tax=Glutamicibacter nicotianae TaxID=37929 RepID=UPI001FC93575|nr:FliI/YscN family ATPase [Glutamicibacter nicotianae]